MEKKTIGGFIAALRRANGMTQKELADRLNVSDKTVSRWERDEGAPDLSLIPVIAEIFGVTCDELLRGQRKSPEERAEPESASEATAKGERERRRLLKSALVTLQNRTAAALGVSAAGLIAALICNFAFLRATLGFYVGLVFFAVSAVCQTVFINRALLTVDDDEPDSPDKAAFRRSAVRITRNALAVTAGLCGFTAPLAVTGAYVGLVLPCLLVRGALFAAGALAVYAVIWYFVGARLVKKGVLALGERERETYWYNHRLQAACAGVLVGLLVITAAGHIAVLSWDGLLIRGTVFTGYDEFAAFMERETPDGGSEQEGLTPPAPEASINAGSQEENRDEDNRLSLYDSEGNEVCSYVWRNRDVWRIKYAASEGGLPITVYTLSDLDEANRREKLVSAGFAVLYLLESAGTLAWYLRRKRG